MKQKHSAEYWLERLSQDKQKLDENKKLELIKALLIDLVPLKPDEADIFLNTELNAQKIDNILEYSEIEKKVGESIGGIPENYKQEKKRFLKSFRNILSGFYTSRELDEIISYWGYCEELIVVGRLVGMEHYGIRRIRNAYLPVISDLIEIDPVSGEGRDMTYTLFDGEGDAVSQIERLVKGKPDS